jgi:hypothetical protein
VLRLNYELVSPFVISVYHDDKINSMCSHFRQKHCNWNVQLLSFFCCAFSLQYVLHIGRSIHNKSVRIWSWLNKCFACVQNLFQLLQYLRKIDYFVFILPLKKSLFPMPIKFLISLGMHCEEGNEGLCFRDVTHTFTLFVFIIIILMTFRFLSIFIIVSLCFIIDLSFFFNLLS